MDRHLSVPAVPPRPPARWDRPAPSAGPSALGQWVRRLGAWATALAGTMPLLAGCASGLGDEPTFGDLGDQLAFVGSELSIKLDASDPNGDPLQFRFESNVPELCEQGTCRAGITKDKGDAYLRWVPRPRDIGEHQFKFFVTDGTHVVDRTIQVEVRSSIGYNGLPRFIQPLGTGTTLDLGRRDCFEFDVIVDDPDSPGVDILMDPPVVEGALLKKQDPFAATFHWCPRGGAAFGSSHRTVRLLADDGVNPPTKKDFLLVLRYPAKPECEGTPPVITHTPSDWNGTDDIVLTAQVSDDSELKHPPIIAYSTTDPGDAPDLSKLTQISMGPNKERPGQWVGKIPNPFTALTGNPAAENALYYVIAYTDADDAEGPCDHTTDAPSTGTYRISVRIPNAPMNGAGDTCDECHADSQCGTESDLCMRMGTQGQAFCLPGCQDDSDCPSDFECSGGPVPSIDNRMGRVCTPVAGLCMPEAETGCVDDPLEDNDSRAAAAAGAALEPGEYESLVSCMDGEDKDDDWYRLEVPSSAQLSIRVSGTGDSDLDVMLVDEEGATIAIAEDTRSQEEIATCVPAGTYFARVYAFGSATNTYRLEWSHRAAACGDKFVCEEDNHEPDDDKTNARPVNYKAGYETKGNFICGGSDDWYRVDLAAGETFAVEATFVHTSASNDLDFHFLDATGKDLTPCSEQDTSTCSAFQGQSLDSNEYYDFTAEQGGTYYLVVHGFARAENSYDIRFWKPDFSNF